MKQIFLFCILILGLKGQGQNNPVVLELFTSQGCSSCPPADALIQEIADTYKNQNIHILSYHVDYWDYIGWKDPFGSKQFTQKQYDYARIFNDRSVYTPQLVIQGREHFTGSKRSTLLNKLSYYKSQPSTVDISLRAVKKSVDELEINYDLTSQESAKRLTIALVKDQETTTINRGENRGRTLVNTHIVIALREIDLLNNFGSITLEKQYFDVDNKRLSIVAYVSNETGILGSTTIHLTKQLQK